MISANGSDGVEIWGMASHDNFIQGNMIGGEGLGNTEHGIYLHGGDANRVGSLLNLSNGNEISYNGGNGVSVFTGNQNGIYGNSIYLNGVMGIKLGTNTTPSADIGDADTGPNNYQNAPVITQAVLGSLLIEGYLNSAPSADYTLEYFLTDIAVYAPANGEWIIRESSDPTQPKTLNWGWDGADPVPGEYD